MIESVTVETRGHVVLIGLNRPAKRNAFDLALYERARHGSAVRTNATRVCAARCSTPTASTSPAVSSCRSGCPSSATVACPRFRDGARRSPSARDADLTKPLVIAVQGWCLTIGIELLLAADMRVAADSTRFAQIEVKRGIFPVGGATVRLVQELGWGNAMRILLTGEEFSAADALRWGLVQEVVPHGQQTRAGARARADCRTPIAGGGARHLGLGTAGSTSRGTGGVRPHAAGPAAGAGAGRCRGGAQSLSGAPGAAVPRSGMIWELARAALFRLEPETRPRPHLRAARRLRRRCLPYRIPASGAGALDGAHVPQPDRAGRRPGQERRPHRRAGPPGLRLSGGGHGHPAPATRQPASAHVPPAAGAGGDQPHGLQQPGRGPAGAQRPVRPLSRHPRHQHRQELRHADRARGFRLPRLHAQGVSAGELSRPSISPRRTPRTCAGCRRPTSSTACSPRSKPSSRSSPTSMAAMYRWRSRSPPT